MSPRLDIEPAEQPDRSSTRAAVTDTAVVLGTFLALGLLCGVLWWLLVDPAMFTKVSDGGSMGEVQLAKRFNGDAWYSVIAAVVGLAAGVTLTWWRSRNFVLTTVLLLVGSGLAAAVMAVTGHLLGPGDPDAALAAATVGEQVPVSLAVTAKASYLVWPMAALIGSLVVLWSPPAAAEPAEPAEPAKPAEATEPAEPAEPAESTESVRSASHGTSPDPQHRESPNA